MGWKNLIPTKEDKKWVTLKVEEEVQEWIKKVAISHKSSPSRVLYAIVRAAFEEDREVQQLPKTKKN